MDQVYDELRRLLRAYFYEDWPLECATPDDVVKLYVSETVERLQYCLASEIRELLDQDLPEADMQALLFRQFRCAYDYLQEWPSSRAWLEHILKLLASRQRG